MTRVVILILALSLAGSPSEAAPVVAGSDPCPVPAETAPYRLSGEVEADDLNAWRVIAEETTPTVDIELALPPTVERVFERYEVDPETGAVYALSLPEVCGAAQEEAPRR